MESQAEEDGLTQMTVPPIRCVVGIMAYNEASNIANAIRSILRQTSTVFALDEIIVVASGCTDDTPSIVAQLAHEEPRVRMVVQEQREGKASAINLFLAHATSPVLVMVSADVVLKQGTLELLVAPFRDATIGMVGGHPIPVNDDRTFLGHAVHLLWDLHDRIAHEAPKLGEVVAFRNVVPNIPTDTAVDEISIQALVTQLGYRLMYEPRAIVYNRGPSTVADFIRQRRRIYSGHLKTQRQQGYTASTMNVGRIVRALLVSQAFSDVQRSLFTLGTVFLEAFARALGTYDYVRRRSHRMWQISTTTKNQLSEVANQQPWQSVLVFRLVNFHYYQIELGGRGVQALLQRIMLCMRQRVGADGFITQERNGTIIVLAPLEREVAEQLARTLIEEISAQKLHVSGHLDDISVEIACGIIAFPQAGIALATSVAATA